LVLFENRFAVSNVGSDLADEAGIVRIVIGNSRFQFCGNGFSSIIAFFLLPVWLVEMDAAA